ncbi:hypothetical protein [Methylobacterium sp. Gmos1]
MIPLVTPPAMTISQGKSEFAGFGKLLSTMASSNNQGITRRNTYRFVERKFGKIEQPKHVPISVRPASVPAPPPVIRAYQPYDLILTRSVSDISQAARCQDAPASKPVLLESLRCSIPKRPASLIAAQDF